MDFVNLLDTNETIISKSIIAYNSVDADVTSSIVIASSITGTIIKVRVQAGTTGNRYKITIRATTDSSNVYEEDVYMYVKEV
jgi:hypothetical protein